MFPKFSLTDLVHFETLGTRIKSSVFFLNKIQRRVQKSWGFFRFCRFRMLVALALRAACKCGCRLCWSWPAGPWQPVCRNTETVEKNATIRAVNDNLLPNKTRNELAEEKRRNATFRDRCSPTRVMISNQRPLKGQFSSPDFNVWYSSGSLPQIETDVPGLCLFLGNVRISITSPQRRPILITSFLIRVHIGVEALHPGVSPHNGLANTRLAPLSSISTPHPFLLTAQLLWNKGQVIRHLEGQLICHPLINASAANLRSRTPPRRPEQKG